jgi:uncharacterized membrane protein SirB2
MAEFYLENKSVHHASVLLSLALFVLRGMLMLARSAAANHLVLRWSSYTIDTVLLTAALMLMNIVHMYPGTHAWLTMKMLLLVAYIVLGSMALKRARTRRGQTLAFVAALAVFALMYGIARAHHPLGWLRWFHLL